MGSWEQKCIGVKLATVFWSWIARHIRVIKLAVTFVFATFTLFTFLRFLDTRLCQQTFPIWKPFFQPFLNKHKNYSILFFLTIRMFRISYTQMTLFTNWLLLVTTSRSLLNWYFSVHSSDSSILSLTSPFSVLRRLVSRCSRGLIVSWEEDLLSSKTCPDNLASNAALLLSRSSIFWILPTTKNYPSKQN